MFAYFRLARPRSLTLLLLGLDRKEIVHCHKHCFKENTFIALFLTMGSALFAVVEWVGLGWTCPNSAVWGTPLEIVLLLLERIINASVLSTFQQHSWSCTCLISGISSRSSQQWWPGGWRKSGCWTRCGRCPPTGQGSDHTAGAPSSFPPSQGRRDSRRSLLLCTDKTPWPGVWEVLLKKDKILS